MASFKYYDDNNLIKNISFGETILKTVLVNSNTTSVLTNQLEITAPVGTNRLTLMGESDGDYYLTIQQYLGDFSSSGNITSITAGALNAHSYLAVYDTFTNVYTKSQMTYTTQIATGSGSGYLEGTRYSAGHSLVLYYNMRFTKPYLSVPLLDLYTTATGTTALRTIAVDFWTTSGKAVEIMLTHEAGRTAVGTV